MGRTCSTEENVVPEDKKAAGLAIARWKARREHFLGQVIVEVVEQRTDTGRIRREVVKVDRVTMPGHGPFTCKLGEGLAEATQRYDRGHPRPAPRVRSRDEWRAANPQLRVVALRPWATELHLAEQPIEGATFDRAVPDRQQSLPVEEIMERLNALARDGWTVVHVSEDRGLYAGPDTGEDSFITRARYMLVSGS